MSQKINVRSPFYLHFADSSLKKVTINIYISTGTSAGSTIIYTLSKEEVNNTNYVVFEISELIRDYIETEFSGTYFNQPVWVDVQYAIQDANLQNYITDTDTYLAFDGYGDMWDQENPELSTTKLISNSTVWKPADQNIRIPFFKEDITSVVAGGTTTFTDNGNTDQKVVYINVGSGVSTVTANLSGGGTEVINVETLDCSKYTPSKLTFYNKYGVLQDLFFFAKSRRSVSGEADQFKGNTMLINYAGFSLSGYKHQYQNIDRNGRERVILSTGFVSEDYNEPLKELMLSEKAWLSIDGRIVPVNVTTGSLNLRTSLNDKKVEYDIEVEYAFDAVQNVR
jgi:hypothetical protein